VDRFECVDSWLGNNSWDLITFNFGLHSLDNPPTTETETIANYTRELRYIASRLISRSKRVLWVTTTPVPYNVTQGPKRHNADVRRYNQAASTVMRAANITQCDAYTAIMSHCNATSGPPDDTYLSCPLQDAGGVHFQPAGYNVLADAMVLSITGRPGPSPPRPLNCTQGEQKYCPGLAGKGRECCSCVAAHHQDFEQCGCFSNKQGAAIAFCREWCKM